MITQELEDSFHKIFVGARLACVRLVTVERLLLGLLENEKVLAVLRSRFVDVADLRLLLDEHVKAEQPEVTFNEISVSPSDAVRRVIDRAYIHARWGGKKRDVSSVDILFYIFFEAQSDACSYLQQCNISKEDVAAFMRYGSSEPT
ncbi:MAG: hypothetical protein RIQ41_321 [Candidatus Parcubacteria bacterium]